jgi:hypothetical protein
VISCSLLNEIKRDTSFYQLQTLPKTLQNRMFLETLTFKQEDQKTLLTQIETSKNSLSLGAMTFSGLPIIQARWHGIDGLVGFSSSIFDKSMVLRIIRDIQLVKWPDEDIKNGLLPGYELISFQNNMNESVKKIHNSDKTVVTIIYSTKKIVLTNIIENYQLTIEQVNE